jgi:alpha-tubulin suppressor-like RCC1 family protein
MNKKIIFNVTQPLFRIFQNVLFVNSTITNMTEEQLSNVYVCGSNYLAQLGLHELEEKNYLTQLPAATFNFKTVTNVIAGIYTRKYVTNI